MVPENLFNVIAFSLHNLILFSHPSANYKFLQIVWMLRIFLPKQMNRFTFWNEILDQLFILFLLCTLIAYANSQHNTNCTPLWSYNYLNNHIFKYYSGLLILPTVCKIVVTCHCCTIFSWCIYYLSCVCVNVLRLVPHKNTSSLEIPLHV